MSKEKIKDLKLEVAACNDLQDVKEVLIHILEYSEGFDLTDNA